MTGLKTGLTRAMIFLFVMLFTAAPAWGFYGDDRGAIGLDGSFRVVGGVLLNYDHPPFFGDSDSDDYLQEIFRLTALGRPADRFSYEIHLVQNLTYSTAGLSSPGGLFSTGGSDVRYRAWDDASDYLTEDRASGVLWLDRFNFKIAFDWADLTVGRQAVTFGKAYFWNPMDVFLPFDPRQFDRDYKAGVDAVRLDVPLGNFSGFTLVGAAGRELDLEGSYVDDGGALDASWTGSALLGRFFTHVGGWDLAVQGGKVYGGTQMAGGLVGELKGLEVRAEASYFWAQDSPALPRPLSGDLMEDHLTAVLGLGRRLDNGLTLEFEFLYNGAGETEADPVNLSEALVRYENGLIHHWGRYVGGFSASYDFTPLLVGRLAVIHSFSDTSTQIQPYVTWSLSDNSELLVGTSLNFGPEPEGRTLETTRLFSEFGTWPDMVFAEYKIYF